MNKEQIAKLYADAQHDLLAGCKAKNMDLQDIIALCQAAARTTTPVSQMTAEPVAWMRKWAFDGEKPAKQRNENGRMAWPAKFKVLPITQGYCFNDDVPLYAAPAIQQPQEAAKPSEGSGDVRDSALKRAASLLDSFYENAKVRGCEKMYEHFAKGAAECRAALSQERRCSMTTNTTNSQAASIDTYGDPRFEKLSTALYRIGFHQAGSGDAEAKALADYIDAKLAQARAPGFEEMRQAMAESAKLMAGACRRATAAEAKLEAIRQGVERLSGWDMYADPMEAGELILRAEVLALLAPQDKADESGPPG